MLTESLHWTGGKFSLRILLQIIFAVVIFQQVTFEIRKEIRVGLHANSPLKSTDFQQIWKMPAKSPLQELIKILSASLLLQADGSTAMKEQISYFLQLFIISAQKFGLYLSQNASLHNS